MNRKRAQQINDFSGLQRRRNITPTDLDGYVEYSGNVFVFLEGKCSNAPPISRGQERALENLVVALTFAKKLAVAVIFIHDKPAEEDVPVHECIVNKVYCQTSLGSEKFKWIPAGITVLEFFDRFEKYAEDNNFDIGAGSTPPPAPTTTTKP